MAEDHIQSWYLKRVEEVEQELQTDRKNGISAEEAAVRINQYGRNEMEQKKGKSVIAMFFSQFKDFMIVILLIAAVVSFIASGASDFADPIIILLIVILNAVIGVVQENKAEKSLSALKKLSSPTAKVIRGGESLVIPSTELVPGDVVILETGDQVPADLRLFDSVNLKIQEAALTGESVPSEKDASILFPSDETEVPLGDRINMAYSSCLVTYGRGSGIVVGTAMQTEVGKIANMLMSVENQETPLQKKLNQLGKYLGIGALVICAVMFVVGILTGKEAMDMFMTAVSLAVAAIPEGLPAISTIVLAMGVKKMVEKNAIMRNLPSVETLGSTSIICSDKTGTLTQNKMTVTNLWQNGTLYSFEDAAARINTDEALKLLSFAGILCNDTRISANEDGTLKTIGDPTETAIVDMGLKAGLDKRQLDKTYRRVYEVPFDSERKLMSVVCETADSEHPYRVYTKGAVDVLLSRCSGLSEEQKQAIIAGNEQMATMALRVLGMAYKDADAVPDSFEQAENGLTFCGLMGMIDPPREEVKEAVHKCRTAGIKPVMITGDHKTTAVAIAKELHILEDGDLAIEGVDLNQMDDAEFSKKVESIAVYSRVAPEHKVRIVKAWQEKGNIVAMTGDGVNDAPALKTADIGAAMGIVGTEVSKEAADMVLTDDNFATIVSAVEEGRRIFDNILKSVYFLLSCNIGEIITLFMATLLPMLFFEEPLLAIHILWVNLVTDSLPALALGIEPAEKDIMLRKPLPANASIFNKGSMGRTIYQGILVGLLALAAFQIGCLTEGIHVFDQEAIALLRSTDPEKLLVPQTMSFAVLAFSQLFHVFNLKSERNSIFQVGIKNNPKLIGACLISAAMMLLVLLVPPLQSVFSVSALTGGQWGIVFGLAFSMIVIVELVKLITRKIQKDR